MRSELWITLMATVLLIVPAGAAAPLTEQVDNGGFEAFTDDDPDEWTVLAGNANPTSDAAEGERAVVLNFIATSDLAGVAQDISQERDDLPIIPNADYDFDFEANLEDGTPTDRVAAPTASGIVIWRNAGGEEIDRDTVSIQDDGSTYVSYDNTFRAPPDATEATIEFALEKAGQTAPTDANLKVDAVSFGPSSPL